MTGHEVLDEAAEVMLLRKIRGDAARLLASGDPMMRGQYLHLLGRVDALLVLKQEGFLPETEGE